MNKRRTGISAILLAAGESRRMGAVNKLGLSIDGESLLHRSARILLGSLVDDVMVVTGHQADTARQLLGNLPVRLVHNDNYRDGQMSSVHTGMAAINEDCAGVMVCLADQPLLTVEDINRLINGFAQRQHGSVLVPTYHGQRGNPIILAAEHRAAILAGNRNLGCRKLIENNPELVCALEMPNDHVVVDMDTPDDVEKLGADDKRRASSG